MGFFGRGFRISFRRGFPEFYLNKRKGGNHSAPPHIDPHDREKELAKAREEQRLREEAARREREAQARAENLARIAAKLSLEAQVAESAVAIASQRTQAALTELTHSKAATQQATELLTQLTEVQSKANDKSVIANYNMAIASAKRLYTENLAGQRMQDRNLIYPDKSEIEQITAKSELAAVRKIVCQAADEQQAAFKGFELAQLTVQLAVEQLNECRNIEAKAEKNHQELISATSDLQSRAQVARNAANDAEQKVAAVANRITPTFRQQVTNEAANSNYTRAEQRVLIVEKLPQPSNIANRIEAMRQNYTQQTKDIARLETVTQSHYDAVYVAQQPIDEKVRNKSDIIAFNHDKHISNYPWYLPINQNSSKACRSVWTLGKLIKQHDAESNHDEQHEIIAGVLASRYHIAIKHAAEVAVQETEKELSRLMRNPSRLQAHINNAKLRSKHAQQVLEQLKNHESSAAQALESSIPNATDYLSSLVVVGSEANIQDITAQKQLIDEHKQAEERYHHTIQEAERIAAAERAASPDYLTDQFKGLKSDELLDLIFKYGWTALTSQQHDINQLTRKVISTETCIFLWDLICIMAAHAPKAKASHNHHAQINENEQALGTLQKYVVNDGHYKIALSRMTNRFRSGIEVVTSTKQPKLDLKNPALHTAAKAATCLREKAQAYRASSASFFNRTPISSMSSRVDTKKLSFGVSSLEERINSIPNTITGTIFKEFVALKIHDQRQNNAISLLH